eukprot:scaffold61231_cov65-Phaeocystis_antarctica.AAC.3
MHISRPAPGVPLVHELVTYHACTAHVLSIHNACALHRLCMHHALLYTHVDNTLRDALRDAPCGYRCRPGSLPRRSTRPRAPGGEIAR